MTTRAAQLFVSASGRPSSGVLNRFVVADWRVLVLAIAASAAIGVSLLAPALPLPDPNRGELANALLAPGSSGHPLGTDSLGRDILSRIIFGLQTTALISLAATVLALALGMLLGSLSGYWRRSDIVIARLVDVQLAFPSLILAIAIIAALGGASRTNIIIVLAITGWVVSARVIRISVLAIKETLYVDAAIATGATHAQIVWRHVVPNILPLSLAMAVSQFPMFMIQAASLDYLGLGVPASTPSLGVMVQEGQRSIFAAWWPAVLPAVVMAGIALTVTFLGEQLNRRIDA